MKGFKFQPVVWMTGILTFLGILVTVDQTVDIVPDKYMAYVTGAVAILTIVLGKLAHNRTTAVADPKTTIDGTLVPLTVAPADVPVNAKSAVPDPQR